MQRNRPVIIGAAVLGLLAIGLTLMSLLRGSAPPPSTAVAQAPAPTAQLVAARDIPPRTVITADMVREDTLDVVDPAAVKDRSAIVGKLTGEVVPRGAVFTPAVLVEPVKRAKPANFAIPAGLRAVALMVDPNATVGGIVDVGDRVDVVVMHKLKYKNEADQEGETRSGRTIGQDLLVLITDAAIKRADTPPAPAPGAPGAAAAPGAPGAAPPPPPPPPPPAPAPGAPVPKVRVVVAAPPAIAERLVAAQGLGELHLTLRDGVGRDQAAIPEVFEYPVRTIGRTVPRRAAAGGGNTGGGRNSGGNTNASSRPAPDYREDFSSRPAPMTPPMMPSAVPAPPATTGAPVADTAEVTVIRGTEKTRVEVPKR